MKITLDGSWNETAGDNCWEVANCFKEVAKLACQGTKTQLVVCGLNALLWYQSVKKVGPKWSIEVEEERCNFDCMVLGEAAENLESMKDLLKRMQNAMRRKHLVIEVEHIKRSQKLAEEGERCGKVSPGCEDEEVRMWRSCSRSGQLLASSGRGTTWSMSVKVRGWEQSIRFVQVPKSWNIVTVLQRYYAVDVERVACILNNETFVLEGSVKKSIMEARASNQWVHFECSGCPSGLEIRKVNEAMVKMRDYTRRGFKFLAAEGASLRSDGVVFV